MASVQQISGGVATAVAGLIVVQTSSGVLEHYDILGYVVVAAMLITVGMMYVIHQYVMKSQAVKKEAVLYPEVADLALIAKKE
jgi:hypothetical protein